MNYAFNKFRDGIIGIPGEKIPEQASFHYALYQVSYFTQLIIRLSKNAIGIRKEPFDFSYAFKKIVVIGIYCFEGRQLIYSLNPLR
jgi:hypothetical protein